MADQTKITELRSLASDQERAERCLSWAEQQRHEYYLGQQAWMRRKVETFVRLVGREPNSVQRKVLKAEAVKAWGDSPDGRDCMGLEQMYGRWADTYYRAATLGVLQRQR
jgi:hypothetical protein